MFVYSSYRPFSCPEKNSRSCCYRDKDMNPHWLPTHKQSQLCLLEHMTKPEMPARDWTQFSAIVGENFTPVSLKQNFNMSVNVMCTNKPFSCLLLLIYCSWDNHRGLCPYSIFLYVRKALASRCGALGWSFCAVRERNAAHGFTRYVNRGLTTKIKTSLQWLGW